MGVPAEKSPSLRLKCRPPPLHPPSVLVAADGGADILVVAHIQHLAVALRRLFYLCPSRMTTPAPLRTNTLLLVFGALTETVR